MEAMFIGMTVGFVASVGFLALGYTLGTHSLVETNEEENLKNKNKLIDEVVVSLERMKDEC
jgi:hypothetical protein